MRLSLYTNNLPHILPAWSRTVMSWEDDRVEIIFSKPPGLELTVLVWQERHGWFWNRKVRTWALVRAFKAGTQVDEKIRILTWDRTDLEFVVKAIAGALVRTRSRA